MALFGGGDQELRVTIKAKDEASKDIAKVNQSVGTLAKGFAVGAVAVGALRSGFRLLSGVVTASISEFEEANAVAAQTNAVLASTGHAAGLSAKQIGDLADSLSQMTLYEDEAIQSAENLLLTFTNITGDTFPRATRAVLDMSTALGQDLSSSAIQLGKALNNPIEGVSALQRVGVSFNNSQQEMIASLVKTGHTLEAQDFILQELEKEFGNSAKSAYDAASSITKLQKNVKNLEEDIGRGLTPALNNVFSAFQSVTSGMGKNVEVGKTVFRTLAAIGEFAANTAAGIRLVAGEFVRLGSYVAQGASIIGIFNKDAREGFKDFRDSVDEGRDTFVDFALTLHEKNQSVLDSWGNVTDEARLFAKVGPAAYEATAEEAAKATKKIEDTKRAIAETRRSLDDYRNALKSDTQNLAEAFVGQEQKVRGIQTELTAEKARGGDADQGRILELEGQLFRERNALERARTIETQLPGEVAESRRRAGATEFERNIEDISNRSIQRGREFIQGLTLNVNFNDVVAGDQGIRDIIQRAFKEINREATLRGAAGA